MDSDNTNSLIKKIVPFKMKGEVEFILEAIFIPVNNKFSEKNVYFKE
jgi:hypothetical protein